ncbi:MAG: hypothetical protein PVH85_32105 [Desulfobacterales bacterium]|jgi:hypothetical protein
MKKTIILTILSVIGGFLFADFALAGFIKDRSSNQRLRIRQGIISGQLTPYEAKILKHEQRRIRRIKKWSWFDGKLTRRERRHIESLQTRASRHIYRLKHNDVRRYRRYKNSNWNWDR